MNDKWFIHLNSNLSFSLKISARWRLLFYETFFIRKKLASQYFFLMHFQLRPAEKTRIWEFGTITHWNMFVLTVSVCHIYVAIILSVCPTQFEVYRKMAQYRVNVQILLLLSLCLWKCNVSWFYQQVCFLIFFFNFCSDLSQLQGHPIVFSLKWFNTLY